MENSQLHEWSRHYDALLWHVTTLFAAAIGGLLVYSYSNFSAVISIVGLFLTCLPVYFAASFRESRDKINQQLSEEEKAILFEGRKLKQWLPYVLAFLILEFLWVALLIVKMKEQWWLWLLLGVLAIAYTTYWSNLGKPNKQNA